MAALMDGFVLANIQAKSCPVSIERAKLENRVAVTFDTSFINIYNVDDQKLVYSWPVRHGVQVTCPILYSSHNDQYVGVFNKTEIRRWEEEEKNLDKAKKKHISSEIHQIFTHPEHPVVVLCKNGAVDFIDDIKVTCESSIIKPETNIIHSTLTSTAGGISVLYITESQDGRCLRCCNYCNTSKEWKRTEYNISYTVPILDISTFTDNHYNTYIFIIGSNKQLYRIHFKDTILSEEVISVVHELKSESCSMVNLDSSQLVIAGLQTDSKEGIGIYDTKYCAVQSFEPYPEPPTKKVKLYCTYNHIFATCGNKIYAFPYEVKTSTIAEFLGKSQNVENVETDSLHVISWSSESKNKESSKIFNNYMNSLIDKSKTPSYTKFSEVFKNLMEIIIKDSQRSTVSSLQIIQLCQRCLTETKFWPFDEISQLLQYRLIPSGISSELLNVLIQKEDRNLLVLSLQKLPGIPEKSLVQVLQYFLSLSDEDCNKERLPKSTHILPVNTGNKICPFERTKTHFIREVLNLPFSDIFLIEELRYLNFQYVLVLLQCLFYLISTDDEQAVTHSTKPKLQNVIDWISCIIDAHVTQLILSPDARLILVQLHEVITQHTQFYNGIVELEAVLTQFKHRVSNTVKPKIGQYCIEVLHVL